MFKSLTFSWWISSQLYSYNIQHLMNPSWLMSNLLNAVMSCWPLIECSVNTSIFVSNSSICSRPSPACMINTLFSTVLGSVSRLTFNWDWCYRQIKRIRVQHFIKEVCRYAHVSWANSDRAKHQKQKGWLHRANTLLDDRLSMNRPLENIQHSTNC